MRSLSVLTLVLCGLLVFITGEPLLGGTKTVQRDPDFGKIPIYFIPNQGQVDQQAAFYARTRDYTLWLTRTGFLFDRVYSKEEKLQRDVTGLKFLGAHPEPGMEAVGKTGHRVNIIKGEDPASWQQGIQTSRAVRYDNVYNGIDLKVYGVQRQVEYDWIVKPGANPGDIGFQYTGVKSTRIDEEGNIRVETSSGELLHQKPLCYQHIDGKQASVKAEFVKTGDNRYGFKTGNYNREHELIIDPVVAITYSTYLGGSGVDCGRGIAVDGSGNIYVTGYTISWNFPIKNYYQGNSWGVYNAFVTKFNSGGQSLAYSTYYGGTLNDYGYDIAVDASGNVYVTGEAKSVNLPGVSNTHGGARDAFFLKLNSSGGFGCSWYIGGENTDIGHAIALDSSNNAYITGYTNSGIYFPIIGAYQPAKAGKNDAFVCKVNCTGIIRSTYLGGSQNDAGYGIDLDASNNVIVCGYTESDNFPLVNYCDNTRQGRDAFAAVLNSYLSGLSFSTLLGGSGTDSATSCTAGDPGYIYLSGETNSTDFPVHNAFQPEKGGGFDAFVRLFKYSDCSVIFSSYLGGSADEIGWHTDIDGDGAQYVSGFTKSNDFPVKNPSQQNNAGGPNSIDLYAAKIDALGNKVYATYLGGSGDEYKGGITVDSYGNAYVTGGTESVDFTVHNPFQCTNAGYIDAIVSKLSFSDSLPVLWVDKQLMNFGYSQSGYNTGSQDFLVRNIGGGVLEWSVSDDASWLTCSPAWGSNFGIVTASLGSVSGLAPGEHTAKITVSDSAAVNSPVIIYVTLRVYNAPPPGSPSMPFGCFESPADSAVVSGSVPMGGWALDDIEVTTVKIYYESGSNLIYKGDASFVWCSRPDVAQVFPQYPNYMRAGWGYLLQSNLFSDGSYTFHAIASDSEGNQLTLGTKTITISNSGAGNPFGDIDFPAPGGIMTGNTAALVGWALTPAPDNVDKVEVYIDGVFLEEADYGQPRPDINSLFPGYPDSANSEINYTLNTIGYYNGMHTLELRVEDTGSDVSGVGSRYINIHNPGTLNSVSQLTNLKRFSATDIHRLPLTDLPVVLVEKGHGKLKQSLKLKPDINGCTHISLKELENLTVALDPASDHQAYLLVKDQLWPLPVGSTLNNKSKRFYWHPGPGHLGHFRLLFLSSKQDGSTSKQYFDIEIKPKFK